MGLNNLCTSILYVLNAADLGVANAFAFRLYKPMAQKDTDEVCRLLNFYKKVYNGSIGVKKNSGGKSFPAGERGVL